MNREAMQALANKHYLGEVFFETRVALNTGKPIEVGYVYIDGYRELFCKRSMNRADFNLCNQFTDLI